MKPIEEQIGKTLAAENGGKLGFVCIYRSIKDDPDGEHDHQWQGTVGEFLNNTENQSGLWCIDGGWGGPPGAIQVRWNDSLKEWENGGFCGHNFK